MANPGTTLPGGMIAAEGGNVLYLDWESNERRIRDRVYRMGKALGLSVDGRFHYKNMAGMSLQSALRELRSYIRYHRIKFVIVDSLIPAALSLGASDGTSGAVRLMTILSSFGADYGVSALAIGHVAKGKKGAIFGSVFFKNLARSTWEIKMEPDGWKRSVTARHNKVNDGPVQSDATTRAGRSCRMPVLTGRDVCLAHAPEMRQKAALSVAGVTGARRRTSGSTIWPTM